MIWSLLDGLLDMPMDAESRPVVSEKAYGFELGTRCAIFCQVTISLFRRMLRDMAYQVRQRHTTVICLQMVGESVDSAEIARDEKPLQIVDSILMLLRHARERLTGSFLRPFEAFPIRRQRCLQLAIENTSDISLVLAHPSGQRFNEMEAHGIQSICTPHAQRSDLQTIINNLIDR